jgi:hypothetical protein
MGYKQKSFIFNIADWANIPQLELRGAEIGTRTITDSPNEIYFFTSNAAGTYDETLVLHWT